MSVSFGPKKNSLRTLNSSHCPGAKKSVGQTPKIEEFVMRLIVFFSSASAQKICRWDFHSRSAASWQDGALQE